MRTKQQFSLALLLAVLAGTGACTKPKMSDAVGEYVGHYGGATERLILRPDGTLWQELRKGGAVIYTNEGTWKMGHAHEDLDFYNFYVAVNLTGAQSVHRAADLDLSPDRATVAEVGRMGSSFQAITLAPDTLYFFERVANPGPPPPRAEKP